MKKIMKKAEMGIQKPKKTYPLLGIENPTPGSVNGQRGVGLSKNIQDGIKSGKLNKDGTTKNPFPKKKMGGTMKKAMMGTSMMNTPMMKKGGAMKKCKYGCK
jgi:hypothetical protein